MKIKYLLTAAVVSILLVSGYAQTLKTAGNVLSCKNVTLSDGEREISRNTFIYGEAFYVVFEDIQGFVSDGGNTFPGMQLWVVGNAGDTVMANKDLYAHYTEGIDISPLELRAKLTVADPMHSNNRYTVHIKIWDKKGTGTFKTEMGFNIIPNDNIKIKNKGISYNEIYLFSKERGLTIVNDTVHFKETNFVIFEGLDGFTVVDGKTYPGISLVLKDADGKILLDEKDLVGQAGIAEEVLKQQIAPNFTVTGAVINNPVDCRVVIWDKKSDKNIETSIQLIVK